MVLEDAVVIRSRTPAILFGALALGLFAVGAYTFEPESQKLWGFYLTGVGGIAAALGELAGSAFADCADQRAGSFFRAAGFIGLTLGSLLCALPDARTALSADGGVADRYLVACGVLIVLTLSAGIVAWHAGRHAQTAG